MMLVLGIDPGTAVTGFGLVASRGHEMAAVDFGVITPPASPDAGPTGAAFRLGFLHKEIAHIIERHRPDLVAVEELFFRRNVTTALAVGEARGVVMLAAAQAGLPVVEYTPMEVKMAVTGYGRAEKRQVQAMVRALLGLAAPPRPDDAADALALAVCAINRAGFLRLTGERAGDAL